MNTFGVNYVHQSFGDYTKGLTAALKQLVQMQVTCIVSGKESPGLSDSASEVLRCRRFRHPLSGWSAYQTVQALNRSDLLHWQAAGNPWVDTLALRIAGRQPMVVTVHDMVPHPGDRSVLPGTFAAIRRLVNKADQIIVHAESVKQQVVDVGVEPSDVHVIAHGELGSIYRRHQNTHTTPITNPGNTVLFFGRMQGYKGLDILIAAMDKVISNRPETRLMVAGDGPALNELRRSVDQRPWITTQQGHVPFTGVVKLFEQAAVVALPYIEASQSGVAALAIGMGRATVASNVGGLVEMVDPTRNGLLIPSANPDTLARALLRVLDDDTLRARLEKGAIKRSQTDLSWLQIAKNTVGVYERAQEHWGHSPRHVEH